ncbi:SMI1/KNR4 family protein [Dactylosporangium sp. NPDC049525]|uniref:SMI1/KNR4 family protein n=1 Tax=Dactylosporangium sp. NPDC049525 TaxID=3154730 RepID=UPI003439418B
MEGEDRTLPAALAAAHVERFCDDHDGHDFQPYDEFMWSVETLEWCRSWIGNPAVDAVPFRVFGQDGSGGLAAFWIRVADAEIETQPIVFLGSEGELHVVAKDLGDYLWLLANGVGPLETVDGTNRTTTPIPALTAVAQRYTGELHRPTATVIDAAQAELHALTALVDKRREHPNASPTR